MFINLPNGLVLARITLIPLILFFLLSNHIEHHGLYALAVFIIASVTDLLDGWLARKRSQVTTFGKYADPIADKLLVLSTLFAFAALGQISSIWIWIILFRELGVMALRAYAGSQGVVISASITGKLKTTFQIALIIALFITFQWDLGEFGLIAKHALTLLAVGITLYSGFEYAYKSRTLFKHT